MKDLVCYKTLPEWDFHTFPKGFRKQHNTKVGTWAKLTVLQGELKYYELDEDGNELSSNFLNADNDTLFIEPQEWHKVQPISEDLRCQLYFYCHPEDYFQKKYKLSATHSEMAEIISYIQSGKALDIGCGNGRNALFLQQQGFDVTAFDKNPTACLLYQTDNNSGLHTNGKQCIPRVFVNRNPNKSKVGCMNFGFARGIVGFGKHLVNAIRRVGQLCIDPPYLLWWRWLTCDCGVSSPVGQRGQGTTTPALFGTTHGRGKTPPPSLCSAFSADERHINGL